MDKVFRTIPMIIVVFILVCRSNASVDLGIGAGAVRRITIDDYVDKMRAGWVGQMAGVG
ncbi:MAG: hypothetical protein PVH77_06985 [Phycisphaerales bacterium]|jgi:hypothetical protein